MAWMTVKVLDAKDQSVFDAFPMNDTLTNDPIALDKIIGRLTEIRNDVTEQAKTRFQLTKSIWRRLENGQNRNLCVTWTARDTKSG